VENVSFSSLLGGSAFRKKRQAAVHSITLKCNTNNNKLQDSNVCVIELEDYANAIFLSN
jgi:hypothetical protein